MGMSSPSLQDDVSKRMEAMVDLLKAVSTLDDNTMISKKKRQVLESLPEIDNLPQEPQEWDDEILSLTKHLQECVKETPERMEIQELQPVRVTSYETSTNTAARRSKRPPRPDKEEKKKKHYQPQEASVDRREQMSREYSEMSYPKIGPGYSDTISVVSDLSIPTVVTNLYVPEEELYKDLPQHISANTRTPSPNKRQPSIGSNMMAHPTPHVEDEETTLMAPSLVAAPSIAAPSIGSSSEQELRAPSQRVVQPTKRPSSGGAAAQRRQSHQAVLAHLQHQTVTSTITPATATAAGVERRRASMPSKLSTTATATSHVNNNPTLTVNDLPPLNFPKDEPSEYGAAAAAALRKKTIGGKRRSLLSIRGNKYAASVTATSTRMLLSQKQKTKPRPSLLMNRSNNRRETTTTTTTQQNVDLDGVLSTMNCDIDFIFQELSVLEDSKPSPAPITTTAARNTNPTTWQQQQQQQDLFGFDEESNIGATAKIKYTLTSVARTLRHDSQEGLLQNNEDDMNWESLNDQETNSKKGHPVLIDEDGFIVSNSDNDDVFDSFAPKEDLFAPTTSNDPFANSFFPNAKKEPKKKTKRKSTATTEHSNKKSEARPNNPSPESVETKESRIDAVEMATKKRIEMLRRLVEYRARHVSEDSKRSGKDSDELEKLDFVEAETMKQIARLRDRLGASRKELGQA